MNMRSWSESSGAMLVPSTFTGWYKKTIITRARPMAIRRSRVQTRISLRKECSGTDRSGAAVEPGGSLLTLDVIWAAFTTEEDAGTGVSGAVEVGDCFSSGLSIFGCLVFIAWPSRPAPDANCRSLSQQGKGREMTTYTHCDSRSCTLVANKMLDT